MQNFGKPWFWLPCMVAISAISNQAVYAQPPSPARSAPSKVGHVPVADVLQRLGAKLERGSAAKELDSYSSHFDRMDTNRDGKHTRAEYVDKGGYMTPQARAGIFRAADGNADGVVTKAEYVLNRIITDEAKAIVQGMDDDQDGLVERAEFVKYAAKLLSDPELAEQVYAALDTNADGGIPIPEYLRVWGQWARAGRKPAEERIAARRVEFANVAEKPSKRPVRPGEGRPSGGPPFGRPDAESGPPSVDEVFERFDGNKDGKLQKEEVPEFVQQFILSADADGDNVVTRKELKASRQRQRPTSRSAAGTPRQPNRQGRPQRISSSPGAHLREFTISAQDARRLKYLLQLPRGYSASGDSWPLILFLHGGGERGEILEKVKVHGPPKIADVNPEFPFVVLSPQCPEGLRWTHQIVLLKHLLDEVVEAYNVDRGRIYLTGLSLGGYGTWNMAMTFPGDFAAIAPMCCGGGMIDEVDRLKGMPVWAFHGARDNPRSLAYHKNIVAAARRAGADVRFTVHPEAGHDGWTKSYENPELYEWFLSHAKSTPD